MNLLARLTAILIISGSLALNGGTTLSRAVIANDLSAVKECLKAGEQVNEIDKWGWTPLMWAVYNRYLPITEYLLEQGANPNIQAERPYSSMARGATALIITGYYGLDDHAAALMKKGARVDLADSNGQTALDFAKQYEFTAVVAILNKGGGAVKSAPAATSVSATSATAATTSTAATSDTAAAAKSASTLRKSYSKLVLEEFAVPKELVKDYQAHIKDCQSSALAMLTEKKVFETVDMKDAAKAMDASTLLVKVEITEMRIVGGAARFWVGKMAGQSYARAKVTLLDAATGSVEKEQSLATDQTDLSAWTPIWNLSKSDYTIPQKLGAIIAGYILTTNGAK